MISTRGTGPVNKISRLCKKCRCPCVQPVLWVAQTLCHASLQEWKWLKNCKMKIENRWKFIPLLFPHHALNVHLVCYLRYHLHALSVITTLSVARKHVARTPPWCPNHTAKANERRERKLATAATILQPNPLPFKQREGRAAANVRVFY